MADKIEIFGNESKEILSYTKKSAKAIAKALGIANKNINIYFVSWQKIKQLNRQFRRKNKPTTILTFLGQDSEFIYPPEQEIFGETIICLSQIKKQAKELGIKEKEWLTQLLIHSFLHLLGFTHKKQAEAQKMAKKEKEIFKKISSQL